jgi:hypothetical protein
LLSLYPRGYQAEYGEELQTVFGLVVNEAAQRGRFSVIRLGWREMRDLPGAAIRERWRERRKQKMRTKTSVLPTFEPGSWYEGLAATAPLLLLGALASLLGYLHLTFPPTWWLETVMALGLFLIPLLLLFALGLIKGLPRWFLPYVGLVVSLPSLILSWSLWFLKPSDPWIVRAVYGAGAPWFGLLGFAGFTILIAATWRPLRPFYLRMRGDWTLLSFGLYGATLMALGLAFDDYPHPHKQPYILVASLILAAGAWVYLRSAHPWQRFLALFAGITLSMAVAATGKAILHANPLLWPRVARHFTWQSEVLWTVFLWGWLVALISAPALLTFLPRPNKPLQAG